MNIRAQIKYWLSLNQFTYERLAKELTIITGKKYTRGSLSGKITRDTITFNEFELIAKIFKHKITIVQDEDL
jgi:hypothetical protein